MPRKRMIDPGVWEDENFGKLSPKSRLLFIGLFSNADDDGYIRANSAFLRSTVFMYDDMSLSAVRQLVDELSSTMRSVHYYEVDGNEYIHLTKWDEYQTQRDDRRVKTTLPECSICHPTSDVRHMSDKCQTNDGHLSAEDKLSKDKISKEKEGKTAARPHAAVSYLLDLPLTDIEQFTSKYDIPVHAITRKAEDLYHYCTSKGKTYKDYRAFLMGALSRDADKLRDSKKTEKIVFEDGTSFVPH